MGAHSDTSSATLFQRTYENRTQDGQLVVQVPRLLEITSLKSYLARASPQPMHLAGKTTPGGSIPHTHTHTHKHTHTHNTHNAIPRRPDRAQHSLPVVHTCRQQQPMPNAMASMCTRPACGPAHDPARSAPPCTPAHTVHEIRMTAVNSLDAWMTVVNNLMGLRQRFTSGSKHAVGANDDSKDNAKDVRCSGHTGHVSTDLDAVLRTASRSRATRHHAAARASSDCNNPRHQTTQ